MHILILTSSRYAPPEAPLAGVFQRAQALALRRAGHTVGVVAPLPRSLRHLRDSASFRRRPSHTENDGLKTIRAEGWSWLPGRVPYAAAWQYRRNGRRLVEQYCRENGLPDVVHAHNLLYAGWFARELRAASGVPVVVTEHNSDYLTDDVRWWQAPMARAAAEGASARLAVSPALCAALSRCLGSDLDWEWVPNLLDSLFETDLPSPKPAGSREALTFLNVASMVPGKNQAMLLDAFADRFRGRREAILRLGGDGPQREGLQQRTRQLGIVDQVAFLGQLTREEVKREMLACDAFVLPSDFETFGVVLAEALACGRPVVATLCGGPEDVVGPEDGILVPPGDASALGDALETMARTAREYDPATLRCRCLSRFGEKVVVEKLLWVYSRVLTQDEAGET